MPYCLHCNDRPLPRSTRAAIDNNADGGAWARCASLQMAGPVLVQAVACQPLLYRASPILAGYKSHPVRMQTLIQNLWVRASNAAFLTMVVLPGHGPAGTHAYSTGSQEERIMCCVPYNLILILFLFTEGKIRNIVLQSASFTAQL